MHPSTRTSTLRFAAVIAVLPAIACAEQSVGFEGVRLGMGASDVRARFQHPGHWLSETSDTGTVTMDWAPNETDDTTDIVSMSFEFHQSLLVAIRATLNPDHPLADDRSEENPDVLKYVSQEPDGTTQVFWITKNCPIHREEVEALSAQL